MLYWFGFVEKAGIKLSDNPFNIDCLLIFAYIRMSRSLVLYGYNIVHTTDYLTDCTYYYCIYILLMDIHMARGYNYKRHEAISWISVSCYWFNPYSLNVKQITLVFSYISNLYNGIKRWKGLIGYFTFLFLNCPNLYNYTVIKLCDFEMLSRQYN